MNSNAETSANSGNDEQSPFGSGFSLPLFVFLLNLKRAAVTAFVL